MSTENKYQFKGTPAPWKPLHLHGLGQHWYSVTDDNGQETQDIYWVVGLHEKAPDFKQKHEVKMANTHLVSAAPELLEFAVMVLQSIDGGGCVVTFQDHNIEELRNAIHKALNITE